MRIGITCYPTYGGSGVVAEKTRAAQEKYNTASRLAAALARHAPRSVAVLPFMNLSTDPENEFFADGITEDVIAQLSKIRALHVVSRTSVMPFKKREHGLREIADRLRWTAANVEVRAHRARRKLRRLLEETP